MLETTPIIVYSLLGLIALVLMASLKIVSESERFAVFVLGRFAGLRGPGLVLKVPGQPQRWQRIKIGSCGEMVGPDLVRLDDCEVPAVAEARFRLGAKVSVVGFEDSAVRVDLNPELATRVTCPECGHGFQI